MEDFQIIELFYKRAESAIQETSVKYGTYLNQVAYNILRNAHDTEEIVNDTYLGAWNAIPPTRPANLKHFLSGITRNLSFDRLDYLLAGKCHAVFVELDECIPDLGNDIERVWEAKEIGVILNHFLGMLDRKTCAVFVARYYYAYSYDELSEEYGLFKRQIKYLLTKTRKELKKYLEREGVTI